MMNNQICYERILRKNKKRREYVQSWYKDNIYLDNNKEKGKAYFESLRNI